MKLIEKDLMQIVNKDKQKIKSDKLEFNTYCIFAEEIQDENKFLSKSLISSQELYADLPHKTNYKWNEVTLCNMSKNEVYIGNTIQNKNVYIYFNFSK